MSPALRMNKDLKDAPFTKAFGLTSQLVLLEFFIDHPNDDYTLREIEENTGVDHRTIARSIPLLLRFNIVTISRSIGQAQLYKFNSDSVIGDLIKPLHDYILNTLEEEKKELEEKEKKEKGDSGEPDDTGGMSTITID